jgi:hypothetical protein
MLIVDVNAAAGTLAGEHGLAQQFAAAMSIRTSASCTTSTTTSTPGTSPGRTLRTTTPACSSTGETEATSGPEPRDSVPRLSHLNDERPVTGGGIRNMTAPG